MNWVVGCCSRMPMVITSILSYVVSLFANVVMYIWFAPYFSCKLNIFFITWTLVLILLMTTISLHSKVATIFYLELIRSEVTSYLPTILLIQSPMCGIVCAGECRSFDIRHYDSLCCLSLLVCHYEVQWVNLSSSSSEALSEVALSWFMFSSRFLSPLWDFLSEICSLQHDWIVVPKFVAAFYHPPVKLQLLEANSRWDVSSTDRAWTA